MPLVYLKTLRAVKSADYQTSPQPWPQGRVVYEGATIPYRDTPHVGNYLRIELRREQGEDVYRSFTNPFGLAPAE